MSTIVNTDADTGRRTYFIETAKPPRPFYSVTTINKVIAKDALIYSAGSLGLFETTRVAHEVALRLAPLRYNAVDQDLYDFEDFEHQVWQEIGKTTGLVKSGPNKGKPNLWHKTLWGRKADVGTIVHGAAEKAIKMELGLPSSALMWDETPEFLVLDDESRKKVEPTLESFDRWRDEVSFTPLASEDVVWIEGMRRGGPEYCDRSPGTDAPILNEDVAARLDVACTLNGRRTILDIKTGKGIYDEMWLQVEVQRRAANARNLCGGGFESAGILHVPAGGGAVKVVLNDDRDRDADMRAFDHAAGLAVWLWGEPK